MSCRVKAWCGRQGKVWTVRAWFARRGKSKSGMAGMARQCGARHVSVRFVQERRGGARQAGRGEARRVVIRFGDAGVLKRVNVWSGNGLAGNPLTKQ